MKNRITLSYLEEFSCITGLRNHGNWIFLSGPLISGTLRRIHSMAIYLHVVPYSCDVIFVFQLYIHVYIQVTYNGHQTGVLTIWKEKKGHKITVVFLFSTLGWQNLQKTVCWSHFSHLSYIIFLYIFLGEREGEEILLWHLESHMFSQKSLALV